MRATGGNGRKNGDQRRFLRAPRKGRTVGPRFLGHMISAACVLASALVAPTMVRAFSNGGETLPVSLAARGGLGSFTPASVDSRLVSQASIRALTHGKLFRFTPAGMDSRPDRAVTVAVRLPDAQGRLIATHAAPVEPGAGFAAVRITPMAFNLGMARGYQSFALPATNPVHDLSHDSAEVRTYSLAPQKSEATSPSPRLEPSVTFDERASPGRSPRTLGTQGDYQLDMGGSYRVMGNLDVTAGLRYSTDRDRLRALTDHRQDSQALYVGTKFRF